MRKALSKKLRFEVLKRDKFTCQYCGAKPPADDVVLHVDHINPVAKGGTNSILNLVTACQPCNSGKKDRPLDDNQSLAKKRDQLDIESDKAEQIKMLIEWEQELESAPKSEADALAFIIEDLEGYAVSDIGIAKLKRLVKKYDYKLVRDSLHKVLVFYVKDWLEDEKRKEAIEKAFSKLPAFCETARKEQEVPNYSLIFKAAEIASKHYKGLTYKEAVKRIMIEFQNGAPHCWMLSEIKENIERNSTSDVVLNVSDFLASTGCPNYLLKYTNEIIRAPLQSLSIFGEHVDYMLFYNVLDSLNDFNKDLLIDAVNVIILSARDADSDAAESQYAKLLSDIGHILTLGIYKPFKDFCQNLKEKLSLDFDPVTRWRGYRGITIAAYEYFSSSQSAISLTEAFAYGLQNHSSYTSERRALDLKASKGGDINLRTHAELNDEFDEVQEVHSYFGRVVSAINEVNKTTIEQ